MTVFVSADTIDPDDPNSDEAIEGRVFDVNYEERSIVAQLQKVEFALSDTYLICRTPVRVIEADPFGLCVAIGPLMFPEDAIEKLRTAIAVFDAVESNSPIR